MPFRLKLKPHERVIIGGAAVRNGRTRTELLIDNQVPILREPEILSPSAVRTPCERIYMALQLAYVDTTQRARHLAIYRELVADVLNAAPSCTTLIAVIQERVDEGRLYQAIKHTRPLLDYERDLISDVR